MAIESIVIFVAGLFLLIKGADFFVEAASKIAKIIGVSDLAIGLTIVAIGTSLPEIAASIFAALSGEVSLAVGTVVGSNIANLSLVMAIAAIIFGRVQVEKKALEKELFIMLMVSILFYYFSFDGEISKEEGLLFIGLFVVYTFFLLGVMKKLAAALPYERFLKAFIGTEKFSIFNAKMYFQIMKAGIDPVTYKKLLGMEEDRKAGDGFEEKLGKRIEKGEGVEAKEIYKKKLLGSFSNQLVYLVIGGIAILFGAQILVEGAIGVATFFGISSGTIGLLLVAVGTSLPELGVSLSSVKKGYAGIFIGNLIGSNISNILLVVGTTSLIAPFVFVFEDVNVPFFFMLLVSALLAVFIQRDFVITKKIGYIFLAIYAIFVFYLYTTLPL
ncbi:calcium/sodium antiporter [archaeon]|nr:calcium/sodium antiporter [archaeon]